MKLDNRTRIRMARLYIRPTETQQKKAGWQSTSRTIHTISTWVILDGGIIMGIS